MKRFNANQFNDEWALVTAGKLDDFNTMTISWGGMGTLWSKPVVTVYIKPCRYTYEFMEKNDYFTVSFFDKKYKKDLGILGTISGRDGDKLAKTSLTAKTLEQGVTFNQAKQTLVCKKIYFQDLCAKHIPQEAMKTYYQDEPTHRMYIGEVVQIIEE